MYFKYYYSSFFLALWYRETLVFTQTTLVTFKITIGDNLSSKINAFLHKKNVFFVELTNDAMAILFSEDVK